MGDSSPTPRPDRTILFVDVCDSTGLYETLGDDTAAKAIMGCLDALRRECDAAGGRVVQRIGDELMCIFGTANAALRAAQAMQDYVTGSTSPGAATLAIRIGCHSGPVLESKDELFGDAVNVAARVAAFAIGGQVLVTDQTRQRSSARWRGRLRALGTFSMKGKRIELEIHELTWRTDETLTQLEVVPGAARPVASLRLRSAGQEMKLDAHERLVITLGRAPDCGIVVNEPRASRRHARIESRHGRFVLIDQSANGTYVRIASDKDVVLRHEELILYAHGTISLGHRSERGDAEFACE
jgi:adenylate cyclase